MLRSLDTLTFDDRFVRSLPGEAAVNLFPREVRSAVWSPVRPTPVRQPFLMAWSNEVGADLGLERPEPTGPAAQLLAGNLVTPSMRPFAMAYGGHQFGNWAGQLGDGRAMVLGEIEGPAGHFELQLKGAGPTPYSRRADGRAVMRSSIREFLCSEAMFHLGVPTTRALSLVATGDPVVRDMFYDGNARPEPGAIVARVAPTFLRFGNFELLAWRREVDLQRTLADYLLRHHYPELGAPGPEAYAAFFQTLARRTAELVASWMALGWVHGVMNTDNMSALGLTIDYGPYGWLDVFDPDFTPNTTDAGQGRYRWRNQPAVAHWNLARLGSSLIPLVGEVAPLDAVLEAWPGWYAEAWRARMSNKLGVDLSERDEPLITELLAVLRDVETDWTLFFRRLADVPREGDRVAALESAFYSPPPEGTRRRLGAWLSALSVRAAAVDPVARRERMNAANPWIVPRNWIVQEVIDRAEAGDPTGVDALLNVLRSPYVEPADAGHLAGRRPDWARNKAGCSALSCSS